MENTTSRLGPKGVPGQSAAGGDDARRQARERAEELVDQWAEQIGKWAAALGHSAVKYAARACEEMEDIWAEAQAIRQGQRPSWENPAEESAPEKSPSIWAEAQALRKRFQSAHAPSDDARSEQG
jgi:hypothetical protein